MGHNRGETGDVSAAEYANAENTALGVMLPRYSRVWRDAGGEIEDLRQEIRLGVALAARSYRREKGRLETLAVIGARDRVLRALRRDFRWARLQPCSLDLYLHPARLYPECLKTVNPEALPDVWPLVLRLPEREREIICRHYYDEQPMPEVVAALGIPRSTAYYAEARALRLLRQELGI